MGTTIFSIHMFHTSPIYRFFGHPDLGGDVKSDLSFLSPFIAPKALGIDEALPFAN